MQPIILLSLPRSGSTLLQRCLAAHPEICSTSESWLLLPGAYALRPRGVVSEYGHSILQMGVSDFCNGLPEKQNDFYREYGDMVARLYDKRFGGEGHRYFLEKTPRNYLIVDEILAMFPSAKIILLWRDPVRLYASIVRSLLSNRWKPGAYNVDITDGLNNLCRAAAKHPDRIRTVRYEELVSNPQDVLRELTDFLELQYHEHMTVLDDSEVLQGSLGDKTGIHQYGSISAGGLQSGLEEVFHNRYRVRFMRKLLREWESEGYLAAMGYSHETLQSELPSRRGAYRGVITDVFSEYRERVRMLFQSVGLWHAPAARQKLFH